MQHYTYVHKRGDSGEIFYVGKGSGGRSTDKKGRNLYWRNIVNKHGFTVDIVARFETDSEAKAHEVKLIAEHRAYGCKLVNMTGGGEGVFGLKMTDESRLRMSKAQKERHALPGVRERVVAKSKEAHSRPGYREKVSAAIRLALNNPITKAKLAESHRITHAKPEVKAKIAAATKGTVWINDGKLNRRILLSSELPIGFIYGRLNCAIGGTRHTKKGNEKRVAQIKLLSKFCKDFGILNPGSGFGNVDKKEFQTWAAKFK